MKARKGFIFSALSYKAKKSNSCHEMSHEGAEGCAQHPSKGHQRLFSLREKLNETSGSPNYTSGSDQPLKSLRWSSLYGDGLGWAETLTAHLLHLLLLCFVECTQALQF